MLMLQLFLPSVQLVVVAAGTDMTCCAPSQMLTFLQWITSCAPSQMLTFLQWIASCAPSQMLTLLQWIASEGGDNFCHFPSVLPTHLVPVANAQTVLVFTGLREEWGRKFTIQLTQAYPNYIPYSGKFSRGPNFRDFRNPRPKCENKNCENLNMWTSGNFYPVRFVRWSRSTWRLTMAV